MAENILSKYGIKEVADVTFYKINNDGSMGAPVLFLDTLKVSTIEETSAQSDATGGKGNTKLISWDHSKEMNVTLEDALFSPKSMAIMFGNGNVDTGTSTTQYNTINSKYSSTSTLPTTLYYDTSKNEWGGSSAGLNTPTSGSVSWFTVNGEAVVTSPSANISDGDQMFGKIAYTPKSANTITIDASSFPGTYYIVGDTYARPYSGGEDEFFQFVIYKAKVKCENTITLQADGDPSTFSMALTVLRNDEGKMMDLIQYKI